MLQGPVHDEMAGLVTAQLLFLEAEDPETSYSSVHQLAGAAPSLPVCHHTTRCNT